jgi:hypothetical protein
VVYDFANMTRAVFNTKGKSFTDSFLGAAISIYAGFAGYVIVPGFGFNSQRTIFDDYNGWTLSATIGAGASLGLGQLEAGGFISGFTTASLNPMLGLLVGYGASGSLGSIPIADVGISAMNAEGLESTLKPYTYRGGNQLLLVDEGKIKVDILSGDQSPWEEKFLGTKLSAPLLSYAARFLILSKLSRWIDVFTDLHNGDPHPVFHQGD